MSRGGSSKGRAARSERGGSRGSGSRGDGPSGSRARRALRIAGIALLVVALIAFVISFISGLGGEENRRPRGDAQQGGAALDQLADRVRVEVLNAAGVRGLASRATDHLRDRGFDVVHFGNASVSDRPVTVVLARTTDLAAAQRVADALGADSVALEPDPQLYIEATVLLGRDWPPAAPSDSAAPGFGARLRDWLTGD